MRAVELALQGVELEPSNGDARWLAAASQDRLLMRDGKPQRYGTHYTRDASWKSVRWTIQPDVTNEERAHWNVPPRRRQHPARRPQAARPCTL